MSRDSRPRAPASSTSQSGSAPQEVVDDLLALAGPVHRERAQDDRGQAVQEVVEPHVALGRELGHPVGRDRGGRLLLVHRQPRAPAWLKPPGTQTSAAAWAEQRAGRRRSGRLSVDRCRSRRQSRAQSGVARYVPSRTRRVEGDRRRKAAAVVLDLDVLIVSQAVRTSPRSRLTSSISLSSICQSACRTASMAMSSGSLSSVFFFGLRG